jgi:cytochrome P450
LISGGTDTTSVTLAWNIAIMCHNPEVQKNASAEIDEFIKLNGRLPLFSERTEVPYCVSVIKECMRYRPTTPFGLPHTVHKDSKSSYIFYYCVFILTF